MAAIKVYPEPTTVGHCYTDSEEAIRFTGFLDKDAVIVEGTAVWVHAPSWFDGWPADSHKPGEDVLYEILSDTFKATNAHWVRIIYCPTEEIDKLKW